MLTDKELIRVCMQYPPDDIRRDLAERLHQANGGREYYDPEYHQSMREWHARNSKTKTGSGTTG